MQETVRVKPKGVYARWEYGRVSTILPDLVHFHIWI